MGYKVLLEYFRESGKWYSSGEYVTDKEHLFKIFEEVGIKLKYRELPGLIKGHSKYNVTVDVPGHPHRHPHLVLWQEVSDEDEEV